MQARIFPKHCISRQEFWLNTNKITSNHEGITSKFDLETQITP